MSHRTDLPSGGAPELDALLAAYEQIITASVRVDAASTAQLVMAPGAANGAPISLSAAAAGNMAFYLDPADFAISGHTTKYRLRASCLVNAVAPGVNLAVSLCPVSAVAGAVSTVSLTAGAPVATVTFTTPAANSLSNDATADFTPPAAGFYVLTVTPTSSTAASSAAAVRATLQMRRV